MTDEQAKELDAIRRRIDHGADRMSQLESAMARNNKMTTEIHDVIVAARVGLRYIGYVGTLVKWAAPIVVPAVAIWHNFWHKT